MRNLNELIGIIKGVSFDGIVNEKEVERLRIWVGKNRNLAYNSLQVSLISMVDDVIADNIITEEERYSLLEKCEQVQQDTTDDNNKFFELNGIIDGIISDGVINDYEVYHLKRWMDEYRHILKTHEPSNKISSAIEDILKDGIVTEQEKDDLLMMLSERIKETQFETKLAHLKREVKGRRNIGIELIDILDDENAISIIHRFAENELHCSFKSYSSFVRDPEIVFISLCVIAMLEYNGKYYENVRAVYKHLYQQYPTQRIESEIRNILNRYRTDEEKKVYKSRIINVTLSNTIVPSYYLPAFFEFIFDIYRVNFDFTLPEDLEEEFRFAYDGLRSVLQAENDEVSVNATKKTYKLIQTTKRLILNGQYISDVIKLSIMVVKLIDKRLRGKPVIIYNPYLKAGYIQWEAKYKSDIEKKGNRKPSQLRSSWKPSWVLKDTEVYLVAPVHKIKSTYNYRDIHVEVLSNGKVIYDNKKPDIREIFGGYKVSVSPIRIKKPFTNISYRLMAGWDQIYDSKDTLFRHFIVFDPEGREIDNNTDYAGTALFCLGLEDSVGQKYFENSYFQLASKKIKLGDTVYLADSIFNFSTLIKPGLFGDKYEHQFVQDISSGKTYSVYKKIKYLIFESDRGPEYHELQVNSTRSKLIEYHYEMNSREGIIRYIVFLPFDEAGIYDIAIFKKNGTAREKLGYFYCGLDPNFNVDLHLLDYQTFFVDVISDLMGEVYKQLGLHTLSSDEFLFCHRGKQFRYLLPFHFEAFQLDGSGWKALKDELWIGNVRQDSTIELMDPDIDEIIVFSDHGQRLNSIILADKGNTKSANIGFLLTYKETTDYVFLVLAHEGKSISGLFCNNKCILREETEIMIDPNEGVMYVNPWFYGEGYVYFEVSNHKGECVFRSNAVNNNEQIVVDGLKSNTKYIITFFEKKKGISLKKNREMKSFEREFYLRRDLLGKEIHLIDGMLNPDQDTVSGRKVIFSDTFVTLKRLNKDGMFLAVIYKTSRIRKDLYSNSIDDVTVEISNDIRDGQLELTIQKNGRELFYDTARRHVTLIPDKELGSIVSFHGTVE